MIHRESCLRGRGLTGHGSPEVRFTGGWGEEREEETGEWEREEAIKEEEDA